MDLIRRKHNNILLHRVTIGEKTISVPVAQMGDGDGDTVLITAGMDGDEYAGIEAAYQLIDIYAKQKFLGNLIILPIVNIPGFEQAVSWNPLDNKYPKHILPGKEKGSSTEKLMYWVYTNFVKGSAIWIDLHSGAATERIQPFVQLWETQKKDINQRIETLIARVKADTIVFSKGASTVLTKNKCVYIRLESGELGHRDKKAILQHCQWVGQLLSEKQVQKTVKKSVLRNVREFVAIKEGIWVPLSVGKTVKKGSILGEVRSLDGKVVQKIAAKEQGICLWRREAMSCKKGDSLYAYGYQKELLTLHKRF